MLKLPKFPSMVLFLTPIFLAVLLFSLLNFTCRSGSGKISGALKLLYTSEVGGRIDPCG